MKEYRIYRSGTSWSTQISWGELNSVKLRYADFLRAMCRYYLLITFALRTLQDGLPVSLHVQVEKGNQARGQWEGSRQSRFYCKESAASFFKC